jgi:hypothetical protein
MTTAATRTTDTRNEADPRNEALRRLAHASEDVRAARSRYLAEREEAWQRYVGVIEKALAEDLRLSPPAGTTMNNSVRDLLDTLRGRVDDLRVQATLGRMELEDLATELHKAADHVVDLLRP